jgi:DNA-binding NarL/FixJ family response regulator
MAVVLEERFGSGVGIRALLALRAGCSYVDPDLRHYLVSASGCRPTPREHQTLQGLARGLTNQAIAGELGISPEKARDYFSGFHHKLEAKNRTQAIGKAMAPA